MRVRIEVANTPIVKGARFGSMAGVGKEVKGAVKKAAEGKKGSSGSKKGKSSGGSGADKAKRAAKEFLK
jgi:hypothetical protein